jgi:DUF4097 and DUF4098 domain-containing protein YvlB
VRVPPNTIVETTSDSGETTIRGVSGAVRVQTQSSAITLESLGGATTVRTGSGAVRVDRISGALDVTTSSSGFTGHRLGSSFRLRTRSGAVDAEFDGSGDVDVDSGSSAIRLHRVRGGLTAKSGSGQVTIYGTPGSEWLVTTRSSKIEVYVDASDGFALDADSRSGDVEVVGLTVSGTVAKRGANGAVAGGGPRMRLSSGSGAIRIAAER